MTTVYPSSGGYFQQDNAPCHKAHIISDWFLEHDNEFTLLKWPPQSPDLNPILFLFGSQRRWSLSLPILTLIFPALLPCLVRDSLCTALQTKILWINWSLNAIDTIETWVSGNLTALTERSQPAIRWRVGEVANRVSGGSFRGGHWRYLPIRNHDNRYFADWIRLCPGL